MKEINKILETFTIIVDTREQDTPQARQRYKFFNAPYVRQKLNFGDYSAFVCQGSEIVSLENKCVIERKYDLSELAMCYCQGRERFTAEFERAKECGAKIYLLVENGNFESIYLSQYRSQMSSKAFLASITTWLARYNCQLIFCEKWTSPHLIKDILHREMKEMLNNGI